MHTQPFAFERAFTAMFRRHQEDSPAIREAHCLAMQFPAVFLPIQPGDHFAGRMRYHHIGFSPQHHAGGFGYFCDEQAIRAEMETLTLSESDRAEIESMLMFWRTENTRAKVRAAFPPHLSAILPSDQWTSEPGIVFPLYRMAGAALNYKKLLLRGIPGLREDIQHGTGSPFYAALHMTLDTFCKSALALADQARTEADRQTDQAERTRFERIAASLTAITERAPQTFHEAIQMVYLFTMHATLQCNFGRMDTYLGDFLAADLTSGRLTRDEALDLLVSFWRMMPSFAENLERVKFDLRVIIGGRGRENIENADQFALLALDASDRVRAIVPQLSLRCYTGMNPALYQRALDLLGAGATFPILYNDDVNIPAVMHAFDVDAVTAARYIPFGCGEMVLEGVSFGTPNAIINLPKALEITLHNGVDPVSRQPMGLALGTLADFATYDDLFAAFSRQIAHFTDAAGEFQALAYRIAGEQAAFLYFSLLYENCIERGLGMFSGGVSHLGGTYETYGNITTADSLTAIRACVYDRRSIAPDTLIAALDSNFQGFDDERAQLLAAPKFGNDDDSADTTARRVHETICTLTRNQRDRTALDSFLVVAINNSAHILLGALTAASADGRKAGEPLTNGHTAANGQERSGITALLNSMVKLDPAIHAGATHNLKFARSMFTTHRPQLEALLKTYFECGGTQSMITVVNRDDLIRAIEHPEEYASLIVRVGGFSARFIDLPPETQREIVQRTLWE